MTSSSEGEILQPSQMIRDRWRIRAKIGGGGFGEIYEAVDLNALMELVAVKVESSKASKQVLKMEVAVLRRLQGKKHACKFYGCGRNEKFNYLVMSLQGRNLADLRRESPRQCFSMSTSIRLSLQILKSIEDIHQIGFLHRDIKPSNFALGRTSTTNRNVYMLDFGLSRQYVNAKGEIRTPRSAAGFRGTVRYASLAAHKNKEMGRQDDLWSLFYMMNEFMQGALPWRKIKDKDEVGKMKEEINSEKFLEPMPDEMRQFYAHLEKLSYHDEPNYEFLSKCLRDVMSRLAIKMDDPYDWEMNYENLSVKQKAVPHLSGSTKRTETFAVRDRGGTTFEQTGMATHAPVSNDHNSLENGETKENRPLRKSGISALNYDNKPKYKRPDFMKPKPGCVNQNVIDAVQARLAAVAGDLDENGVAAAGAVVESTANPAFNRFRCRSVESRRDLFKNLRVETSLENASDVKSNKNINASDVANRKTSTQPLGVGVGAVASSSADRLVAPGRTETTSVKLLKNTSFTKKKRSAGSRCSFMLPTEGTVTQFAVCEDDAPSAHQKHGLTLASKWQGSFDESLCDDDGDQLPHEPPSLRRNASTNNAAQSPRLRATIDGQSSPMLSANANKSPTKSPLKQTNSVEPHLASAQSRGFNSTTFHQGAKLPSSLSASNVQQLAVNQASVNANFPAPDSKSASILKQADRERNETGSQAAAKSVPLIVIGGDDQKNQEQQSNPTITVVEQSTKNFIADQSKTSGKTATNADRGGDEPTADQSALSRGAALDASTDQKRAPIDAANQKRASIDLTNEKRASVDLTNEKRASVDELNNNDGVSGRTSGGVHISGSGGGFFSSHFRSIRASFQDLLPTSSSNLRHHHSNNALNDDNAPHCKTPNKQYNNQSSSSGVSTAIFRTALKKSPTEKSTDSGVSSTDNNKSTNNLHADSQSRFLTSNKLTPRRNASFKEPSVLVATTIFNGSVDDFSAAGEKSPTTAPDAEKELRRQRRFRRRSDCESFRELAQKMNQSENNNDARTAAGSSNDNASGGVGVASSAKSNVNNLASNVARSVAVAMATGSSYPYSNANDNAMSPATMATNNYNLRSYGVSCSASSNSIINGISAANRNVDSPSPIGHSYFLRKNLSIHQPPTMAAAATLPSSSTASPLKQRRANSYFHEALAVFSGRSGNNNSGNNNNSPVVAKKSPTAPASTTAPSPPAVVNGQLTTATAKTPLISTRRKRYQILS